MLCYKFIRRVINSERIAILILSAVFLTVLLIHAAKLHAENSSDEKIYFEIVDAFKTKGEEGLRDFAKNNKERISLELIRRIAGNGVQNRNQALLAMAHIIANEKGDEQTLANVNYRVGYYFRITSQNELALKFLETALPIYEKLNDLSGQGYVYDSKGVIYFRIGDNAKAMEMYEKAMHFFVKANDPVGQGNVYRNEGEIYSKTGDNVKALELYEKALLFYVKANEPLGLGNVYQSEGDIYSRTGDNAKALAMYEKALPYFVEVNDPLGQGLIYKAEGNIYAYTGDIAKAAELYGKAMSFFTMANAPASQGTMYMDLGDIYANTGDTAKAVELYEEALPFFVKANNPLGEGNVYSRKGDIYFRTGDNAKALEMYEKALSLYIKQNNAVGQGTVYASEGAIYSRTGDNTKALEMYEKALGFFTRLGAIELEAYTLFGKVKLFTKAGRVVEAAGLYEAGMTRLEKVRKQAGFSEMKKAFMGKVYDYYEEATIFMLDNKYNDKAFKYAESMKARVFLDQLAEGLVDLEKGIDPTLKKKRDGIEGKLSALNKQTTAEVQKQKPDESKIKNYREEVAKKEAELEDVIKQLKLKNPEYARVQYPEPVTIKKLQNEILKRGEVLLEYFIFKEGVYCFVITADQYEPVKLKATKAEIEKATELLLKEVQIFNKKSAMELYDILVRPLEGYIKDKSLVIIPDGILTRLPFEALMLREKEKDLYLLEKYSIKYVQSASVLEMLRTKYKEERLGDKFIGFGDPVYDYESFKAGKPEKGNDIRGVKSETAVAQLTRSGYIRAGGMLDRLEGSGKEVTEIETIFKGKNKDEKGYLRLDAREEDAKALEMEQYGYIHYSTHGILDDGFQAIALSQIPDSKEDGMLTLGEIMNSRYNAKLVVLSACQTGLGKMERGEGVTGLTKAVMYAGTPAVVVSLWSVSEGGTKELMVRFYKNMIEKSMTKENALLKAKIEMLKTEYKKPFFWSAFVLYGE